MSNKTTRTGTLATTSGAAPYRAQNAPYTAPRWVRNKAWPALPSITSSDEKFVGICAVWPGDNNWASVNLSVSSGTVTVDWGDGSTSTPSSGAQSDHAYDFADGDLAGTDLPVTFTDSTDKVGLTSQPYSNGDVVRFYNIVSTTGITDSTPYFVVNAGTNDFQVSLTAGGSAITLTTNGTGTMLPYKCAVVTITPTTGGSTITSANVCTKHAAPTNAYCNGWLDTALSMSGSNQPTLSGDTSTSMSGVLQRVNLLRCGATSINSGLLQSTALALQVATLGALASVTTLSQAFVSCSSLTEVTLPSSTGTVTSVQGMFQNCRSLQAAPAFTTSTASVTSWASMFSGCSQLSQVPLYNTTAATDMSAMFSGCSQLSQVPSFNTASVTTMATMFSGCTSLVQAPMLNTAAVTTTSAMFSGCTSLKVVPLYNTGALVTASSMFNSCSSLSTVPLLNTASVTTMASMFNSCLSLEEVPLLDTGAVTSMSSMFNGCTALATVPKFNTAAVTTMLSMFNGCTSLQHVPLFNTAAVTTFSQMFNTCTSLQYLPSFNTSAASGTTGFTTMLAACTSVREVPAWSMGGVSSSAGYTNVFTSCRLTRIKATGIKFTFTVANNNLSAAALNELYTNLATVTSQTVTVTGNYGTSGDTPSIATSKGWTVTGS